jgi:hypothetical protein
MSTKRARVKSAAQLLGSMGGSKNTAAQKAARARNRNTHGQPRRYRLTKGTLERRDGDRWLELNPPFDRAAREALRRLKAR